MPQFKYKEEKSDIFGNVKRPVIKLEIYSELTKSWLILENVLVDSGADISLLPRDIGESLVKDITEGREVKLRGIVPFIRLPGFIHKLKLKLNGAEFEAPVVIVDSEYAHPIFGRIDGMDRFAVSLNRGRQTEINY